MNIDEMLEKLDSQLNQLAELKKQTAVLLADVEEVERLAAQFDDHDEVCAVCCDECKKHGETVERERIIKLLDDNWVEPMDWLSVIALIKGEQK